MEEVSRQKRAELAGTAGAGVLGAGLGVLLAQWAAPYALALVIVGVVLHGWGMVEKHRMEAGAVSQLRNRRPMTKERSTPRPSEANSHGTQTICSLLFANLFQPGPPGRRLYSAGLRRNRL